MIMFVMAVLLLIPLYCAVEALWATRGQERARAVLLGISAGGLIWNGPTYADAFPGLAWGLGALGIAALAWAAFRLRRPVAALVSSGIAAGAVFVFWDVGLMSIVNREAEPKVEHAAATAGPRVLIVYHPGGSGFQDRLVRLMAGEFAAQGVAADVATASAGAPEPKGDYALLVLSTPTYNWGEAAVPIQRYAAGLAPLGGLPVAGVTTGAGWTPNREVEALLAQAGGDLVGATAIFTTAPNFRDGAELTADDAARAFARDLAMRLRDG
jgi:hypothetical protein